MKHILLKILRWILKKLSQLTIWRFQPEVIAITGSVGKTSAKEAIFSVLAHCENFKKKKWRVRKANENFNNELGTPLAVLGNWGKIGRPLLLFWFRVIVASLLRLILMPPSWYPKILILEYGAAKPGDIKYLLNIAKPKIGVITAVGEIPVHNEFSERKPDIKISNFENRSDNNKPLGISFKIEHKENFVPIFLNNIFGMSQAYAVGAAVIVGLIYGLNLVEISELISANYKPAKSRLNLISGVKNTYIMDDSYN